MSENNKLEQKYKDMIRNKLEQKYKDMIRKMATRAGSVVSDSYRDLFIEMAMEYLDSNGTTALSEALAKNADKYVSMLELGELITDTGSFIQSINQYSYASEIRKPQLAKEILSNFFGMADFVAGEIPLDPLFGAYISLVFEVADYALNEGADMLEERNNQLLDVMELCDMAVNKPSSFDEYYSVDAKLIYNNSDIASIWYFGITEEEKENNSIDFNIKDIEYIHQDSILNEINGYYIEVGGIKISDNISKVLSTYGTPSENNSSSSGENGAYTYFSTNSDNHSIAFYFTNSTVGSIDIMYESNC